MAELKWTTDRPTQTGVYWAYEAENPYDADVYIVEVFSTGPPSDLVCYSMGGEVSMLEFSHWMGPLEIPQPPEVKNE